MYTFYGSEVWVWKNGSIASTIIIILPKSKFLIWVAKLAKKRMKLCTCQIWGMVRYPNVYIFQSTTNFTCFIRAPTWRHLHANILSQHQHHQRRVRVRGIMHNVTITIPFTWHFNGLFYTATQFMYGECSLASHMTQEVQQIIKCIMSAAMHTIEKLNFTWLHCVHPAWVN